MKHHNVNQRLEHNRQSLFNVLVLDLGYKEAPEYGQVPIRHVCLWEEATKGMSVKRVAARVRELLSIQEKEIEFMRQRKVEREKLFKELYSVA